MTTMTEIGFILARLEAQDGEPAIFWRGQACSGSELAGSVSRDIERLAAEGITQGTVVILCGDYSPRTIALLLALIELKTIVSPLLPATLAKTPALAEIVNPAFLIDASRGDDITITPRRAKRNPRAVAVPADGRTGPG